MIVQNLLLVFSFYFPIPFFLFLDNKGGFGVGFDLLGDDVGGGLAVEFLELGFGGVGFGSDCELERSHLDLLII